MTLQRLGYPDTRGHFHLVHSEGLRNHLSHDLTNLPDESTSLSERMFAAQPSGALVSELGDSERSSRPRDQDPTEEELKSKVCAQCRTYNRKCVPSSRTIRCQPCSKSSRTCSFETHGSGLGSDSERETRRPPQHGVPKVCTRPLVRCEQCYLKKRNCIRGRKGEACQRCINRNEEENCSLVDSKKSTSLSSATPRSHPALAPRPPSAHDQHSGASRAFRLATALDNPGEVARPSRSARTHADAPGPNFDEVLAGFRLDGSGEGHGADFEGPGRLDTADGSFFPLESDHGAADLPLDTPLVVDALGSRGHSSRTASRRWGKVVLGEGNPMNATLPTSPGAFSRAEETSDEESEWVSYDTYMAS